MPQYSNFKSMVMSMWFRKDTESVINYYKELESSLSRMGLGDWRRFYTSEQKRSGGPPARMASIADDAIRGKSNVIPIRRYRPTYPLAKQGMPTIIYFHGGGWVMGGLNSHDLICREIAYRSHCQVIAVDYRLAPENHFLDVVSDAMEAFECLVNNPEAHRIDPARLAIAGDSAGGHLSAVVAINVRNKNLPLALQVLIYPATDMRPSAKYYPSRIRNADIPPLTADSMDQLTQLALGDTEPSLDWRYSPVLAESLEAVAPALVITLGADILMDEGILYANYLKDCGVECQHVHYPNTIHSALEMLAWMKITDTIFDCVSDTIRNYIG